MHGWEGNPEKDWFGWIKKELERRGFSVVAPALPDSMNPQTNVSVSYLSKVVGIPNELEYEGYKNELSSFFQTPVDWEEVKKHCSKFVAIHSTDDPWVLVKHNALFQEKFGAKSIVEQGRGHYNDKEYPVILETFMTIAEKRD